MSVYAIGDLHLSFGTDKPMDVFGARWDNYVEKMTAGFSALGDDDTCVLCGDVSWGMSLSESAADFKFIDRLPGRKLVLKGNHDYWWSTASKMTAFFNKEGITTIDILNNNAFIIDGAALCGTRGWFFEEETGSDHDRKVMNREVLRLEASLKAAGDVPEKLCFLHYPPVFKNYVCRGILDVLHRYNVRNCWYGHIHGLGHQYAVTGLYEGISFHMVSADYVQFSPVKVR
ncbi:metallophosphoesterase [Oscillospiraceae bacterium CM]|nr:metallophosphoesterase [Oscillospiraceae bacterium CM]